MPKKQLAKTIANCGIGSFGFIRRPLVREPFGLANGSFPPIADTRALSDVVAVRRDRDKWPPRDWVSTTRYEENLLDDLQLLFGDLCRHWGFCSALADDILPEGGTLTAEDFATAMLLAEGWSETDLPWEWREKMIKVFSTRYGPSISAADFESRVRG